jgi:hypothetical protein
MKKKHGKYTMNIFRIQLLSSLEEIQTGNVRGV